MPSRLPPKPRLAQAPQHNPYDKFTQDEFDAWIGGITGALKRALGKDDQVVSPPVASSHYSERPDSSDEEEVERLVEFLGNSSDEETETSFSYSAVRRVSKGKARDPRDGPGFGRGEQNEPIFIGSDSDEEEESEDSEEDDATEEWDSEKQDEEDDDKCNIVWAEAESSVQARRRHERQGVDDEIEEEDEDEDEEEFGGDELQGDDEDDYDASSPRQLSSPVLVVDSDEEDEVHDTPSQGRVLDGTESITERFDGDDTDFPLSTSIRIGPPRYLTKEQRHVSPTEARIETYEDIQPLEHDTSFPPHELTPLTNEDRFLELSDRWVGPETYAEDYYSDGDVKESHNTGADILGIEHDERQQATVTDEQSRSVLSQQHSVERYNKAPQVQEVIQLDVDEVQPLSEDTSFPPKDTEDNHFSFTLHQPIEIPDPWVGPKTYAEDFYSGGDVRPLQNGSLDPHRLEVDNQSGIITFSQHGVEEGEAQPSPNMGAEDLSHKGIDQSPKLDYTVELEPWDGPIDHEENYPAQVEIKSSSHIVENQSAVGNDGDIQKIVDFEDENAPINTEGATARSSHDTAKLTQEYTEGRAVRVLDSIASLAPSRHKDTLEPLALGQAKTSDVLYDDIVVPAKLEHSVHDHHQEDAPALDWMNKPTFIPDIPANTVADAKHPNSGASTNESSEVIHSNEKAVNEIRENCVQGTNFLGEINKLLVKSNSCTAPALEAKSPSAKVSAEEMVDAVDQLPTETQFEAGLKNTPETSKVGIRSPSASLGPTGVIDDSSSTQHDQELEIRNLLTMARDETKTDDKVGADIDSVLREDLVAPEISDVGTDVKLDVGDGVIALDSDPVPGLQSKSFIQSTIMNHTEVLDGDPVTEAIEELNFGSGEPANVAIDLNNSALTLPESELIVSRSATPTLIEGSQSLNSDAHTSVNDSGEIDSQIAPTFQDNSTPNPMAHRRPINTPHSQSPAPVVAIQQSLNIAEPPEALFHHLTVAPLTPETFHTETATKEQSRPDSFINQGTISVDSGIDSAPSDRQQPPLSSLSSDLFPDPALPWIGPYSVDVVMRKASEPFLFADPYPASLSTPADTSTEYAVSFGQIFSPNFSPSSHDAPESSQTGRNDVSDRIGKQVAVPAQPSDEDLPFQQGSSVEVELVNDGQSTSVARKPSASQTFEDAVADNTTQDTDPQDEVPFLQYDDPTRVELANEVDPTLVKTAATGLSSPALKDFDKSLELDCPTDLTPEAKDNGGENTAQQSSPLSSPAVERAGDLSPTRVRSPPLEDDLPSILIIKKVHTTQTPVKGKVGRSWKRKRTSSVSMMSPVSTTASSKKPDKNKTTFRLPAKLRVPHRKGSRSENRKSKDVGVSPISQGSCERQSVSSRSSSDASAARRMLESSSRGTSRASSIASTAPSDNLSTQLSPTLGRGNSLRHQPLQPPPPPPPVPLFHRHHHNRPQQSRPVPNQRTSSSARQHDSTESSTSKQGTSSLHRHPTYSSSPVTRSNCRYHKISIPLDDESDEEGSGDEDVKLVYFLVPGCSLGNKELNRDEKIIDHGDAQPSDGLLMTSDLDAYAFNAPLLSVLRLLVGVDMLREGEIYYLPLPGSDWVPRKVCETSAKMRQSSADHGLSHVTPRRNSNMSIAPVAGHGPASTMGPFRSLKPSSTISQTSSELTDVDDSPQLKRFGFSSVGEEGNVSKLEKEIGSPPRKLKVHSLDTEYRPRSQDESNHLDEHAVGRARSSKGHQHGLKRSRTSDVIHGTDNGRKLKKQKMGGDAATASST